MKNKTVHNGYHARPAISSRTKRTIRNTAITIEQSELAMKLKLCAIALGLALALGWLLAGVRISAQTIPNRPMASVIYVDTDATGPADGLTWSTAFTNVQEALTNAELGDEIWVAEGVYTPTNGITRTATFQLKSGVALYGGFVATETLLTQRDWETHVTVLSGDLDGNDTTDENGVVTSTTNITGTNAYHVVSSRELTPAATLDGFTITAGKALASNTAHSSGGGMYSNGGALTLANITFSGNIASNGGGMYNYSCDSQLSNVIFRGNTAFSSGGGMHNDYAAPHLVNVTFSGNTAYSDGGGMYSSRISPVLVNVIFRGNTAFFAGGGMHNESKSSPMLTNVTFSGNVASHGGGIGNYLSSEPRLYNCILWGNTASDGPQIYNNDWIPAPSTSTIFYSLVQGSGGSGAGWDTTLGTDGGGNIDADPQFVCDPDPGFDGTWGTADDDYGDLRLGIHSPAIDAGDNGAVPFGITTDLDGNPRFFDVPFIADTGNGMPPIVDMGAYEADWLHQYFFPLAMKN